MKKNLDGKLEINADLRNEIGGPWDNDYTYLTEGYDAVIGRYFSSTSNEDRHSENGIWDRDPNSYDGTFSGDCFYSH